MLPGSLRLPSQKGRPEGAPLPAHCRVLAARAWPAPLPPTMPLHLALVLLGSKSIALCLRASPPPSSGLSSSLGLTLSCPDSGVPSLAQ